MCVFEPVQHPDQKDTSLTVSRLHYLLVTIWSRMYSEYPEKQDLSLSSHLVFEIEQNVVPPNLPESQQGSTNISNSHAQSY